MGPHPGNMDWEVEEATVLEPQPERMDCEVEQVSVKWKNPHPTCSSQTSEQPQQTERRITRSMLKKTECVGEPHSTMDINKAVRMICMLKDVIGYEAEYMYIYNYEGDSILDERPPDRFLCDLCNVSVFNYHFKKPGLSDYYVCSRCYCTAGIAHVEKNSYELHNFFSTELMDAIFNLNEYISGLTDYKTNDPNSYDNYYRTLDDFLIVKNSEDPDFEAHYVREVSKGTPLVLKSTVKDADLQKWTPAALSKMLGNQKCTIHSLEENRKYQGTVSGFFKKFKTSKGFKSKSRSGFKIMDFQFGPYLISEFEKVVPLKEYTTKKGAYNLANYLPKSYVPPMIGPYMFAACGNANLHHKGTTRLHIDASDAINIMMYASVPTKSEISAYINFIKNEIGEKLWEEYRLLNHQDKFPGAIWHIFRKEDYQKINNYLENTRKYEPGQDLIACKHSYITREDRAELSKIGVKPYTILQYEGDTVFVPVGAPHQVLNITDCIKVAIDYVPPFKSSIDEIYKIIDRQSQYPESEDLLQPKNMVLHSLISAIRVVSGPLQKNNLKIPKKLLCPKAKVRRDSHGH